MGKIDERIWNIKEQSEDDAKALSRALRLPLFMSRLLINRGISKPDDAMAFLNPDESAMHDPFLMRDMDKAVKRICRAVKTGEKITVYGDFDADGITAVCALSLYLKAAGGNADYYIPDRAEDGYGIHAGALASIRKAGTSLIITVDTGIAAAKELSEAAKTGLDAVVTDHHECQGALPECCAVLNPHRPDCPYPFKGLAGVGVTYKLITALDTVLRVKSFPRESILSLAAIGTVADIVPLAGENRALVRMGLDSINLRSENPGVRALILAGGGDPAKRVTASTIAYILAPRINAAGRVGSANTAADMFLSDGLGVAARLAARLCEDNRLRREIESDIFAEAVSILEEEFDPASDNSIVLCREGWHAGVTGIVASRLAERYHVPVIVLTGEEGAAKGSGRSVRGINLFRAVEDCASCLDQFGGHEMALGLTLPVSAVAGFKKRLQKAIRKQGAPEPLTIDIDCVLEPRDITLDSARALEALEPCGAQNPAPCFALKGGTVISLIPLSGNKHSKLMIKAGDSCFACLFFKMPLNALPCAEGDVVDLAFSLELNTFRQTEGISLILRDIKTRNAVCADELERIYKCAQKGDFSKARIHAPAREDLETVYLYFTERQNSGITTYNRGTLPRSIENLSGRSMNLCKLLLSLDIFAELDIFAVEDTDNILTVRRGGQKGKTKLSSSPLWRALSSCGQAMPAT